MTAAAAAPRDARHPARATLTRIALAGLAGGAVDFAYASALGVVKGRGIVRVWQGVAGGWLGKAAADGGFASFALGVVTHFGIATAMAAAYALAARRAPALYSRWPLFAPLYGLLLYAVMYGLVLRLRWPQSPPHWNGVISMLDIASHVGLACAAAFVLSRASFDPDRNAAAGASARIAR